jgi:hypothetical protein
MMKWFGENWYAAICDNEKIPVPTNESCAWCEEELTEEDKGVTIPHSEPDGPKEMPYHLECFMRQVIGSVGHIQGKCHCFGGTEEDPPEMTKREAALVAFELFQKQGPHRLNKNDAAKNSAEEFTDHDDGLLYVVRLYDGFDNQWMDVSDPVCYTEARKVWDEKTKKGTEKVSFEDIDYFKIFPADTKMICADGFGEH